jgi:hypothetical protein
MFRRISALIFVAALTAAWSHADARVIHPVLNASAAGGRHLFGLVACGECVALCQQVAIITTYVYMQHIYYIAAEPISLDCVQLIKPRAGSLQNAVLHDGDAARGDDAAAAAGHGPAHHDDQGSDGRDEAGPGDQVFSWARHRDGIVAGVVQG